VTDPTPLEDLTADDDKVERTDNGQRPDDPAEQPSQNPGDLPAGTDSEVQG
jgi:hypothetical protein